MRRMSGTTALRADCLTRKLFLTLQFAVVGADAVTIPIPCSYPNPEHLPCRSVRRTLWNADNFA